MQGATTDSEKHVAAGQNYFLNSLPFSKHDSASLDWDRGIDLSFTCLLSTLSFPSALRLDVLGLLGTVNSLVMSYGLISLLRTVGLSEIMHTPCLLV